jgi:hypothetical protein
MFPGGTAALREPREIETPGSWGRRAFRKEETGTGMPERNSNWNSTQRLADTELDGQSLPAEYQRFRTAPVWRMHGYWCLGCTLWYETLHELRTHACPFDGQLSEDDQ